jgi:hypothetical protein
MQIPGVDNTESLSPEVSDKTVRLIVGLFLHYNHKFPSDEWKLELFDVEATFLMSELDTEIFIKWPQGMAELGSITRKETEEYCRRLTKLCMEILIIHIDGQRLLRSS